MKNFSHLFLSFTLLFAAACANDELSSLSGGDVQSGITAVILNPVSDDVETKALSGDLVFSWGTKDKIDVFGSESGEQMIYGVKPSAEDPKSCVFKVVSFGLVDGPYNSIYPTQGAVDDPESIPVSFSCQVQNGKNNTEHLAALDYNAAKTEIKSNAGVFAFEHLVSWIRVHLTFTSACTVDAITLSSSSDSFVGDATIDAYAGTLTKTTSTNSLRLAFKEPISVAAGEDIWGYFTLAPTSLSNIDFSVAVENNGEVLYSDKTTLTTTFTAGKYKTLSRTFGSGIAMIGSTVYESLNDAFAAVKENEIIEVLKADTYDIIGSGIANVPAGVTVKAKVDNVVFNCKGSGSAADIKNGVSFDGITFEMGQTEYHGFYHSGTIAFNNCKIKGYYKTYGKTIFDACTFTQTSYDYCLNAYGTDLDLINCEFNNVGKAFYVYNEGNSNPFTVNVDGCIFNVNYDGQTMAKTQIFVKNNVANQKYTVNITGCELNVLGETDYSDKSVDPDLTNGQGDVRLWNVEEGETGPVNSTVFVNLEGVQVYPFVAPSVAKIGDTYYATLEDAIKAAIDASDGTPVELLNDITYAEGSSWTPIEFKGGTVVIDGKGYTVKGLPGMLFAKQGSGGHHLRMSNITFDGAKVSIPDSDYAAVIVGYADCMNELYFENVTIKNSQVTGKKYAAAFVGVAAGYQIEDDGPVYQHVTFTDCIVEGNTITGGGSTGALMGHAAMNPNTVITVVGTTVTGNTIKSASVVTKPEDIKAGSLFGTAGDAGADSTEELPKGLYVSATVSGNTVSSGETTITTICGRKGSTGGRLVMTEGGSYDARPYNESDSAWASCAAGYTLSEVGGVWTVVKAPSAEPTPDYTVNTQTALVDAVAKAESGAVIALAAGEYNLNEISDKNGRELTFIGAGMGETTLSYGHQASAGASDGGGVACYSFDGSGKITIKNVTFVDPNNTNDYNCGFVRAHGMVFENCEFTNTAGCYGDQEVVFKNCLFSGKNSTNYNTITYSNTEVTYDGCTFYAQKGAIQLYRTTNKSTPYKVTVKDCSFKKNSNTTKTPVYFYDDEANGGIWTISIEGNNLNIDNSFETNESSGSWIWGSINGTANKTTVTINGTKVR